MTLAAIRKRYKKELVGKKRPRAYMKGNNEKGGDSTF